jgi:hypothetical protein
VIYPFLAKYAGLIKSFRSAAVCAQGASPTKNWHFIRPLELFVKLRHWIGVLLLWSIYCALSTCMYDFSGIIDTYPCNISIHGQPKWYGAQSTHEHSFASEKYILGKSTWDETVKILLFFLL